MYGYEIWLEGNCLRSGEGYESSTEAEEEAYEEVMDLLYEEGYADDDYDEDDFEIKIV